MKDDKYIVFKRSDWEYFKNSFGLENLEFCEDRAIDDAVVIRTQDVFAGPALHTYAASINVAAHVIGKNDPNSEVAKTYREIAHYFHERALEADAGIMKGPD